MSIAPNSFVGRTLRYPITGYLAFGLLCLFLFNITFLAVAFLLGSF